MVFVLLDLFKASNAVLAIWSFGAGVWIAFFALHRVDNRECNGVTQIVGRPIAFTQSTRERISIEGLTDEKLRINRLMFVLLVVVVVGAVIVGIAN